MKPFAGASPRACNVFDLMPSYESIPRDFRRKSPWAKLASDWFFRGLNGEFKAKPGIDKERAIAHLDAILRSFRPAHEHKEAAVAWLMSEWFEEFVPAVKK